MAGGGRAAEQIANGPGGQRLGSLGEGIAPRVQVEHAYPLGPQASQQAAQHQRRHGLTGPAGAAHDHDPARPGQRQARPRLIPLLALRLPGPAGPLSTRDQTDPVIPAAPARAGRAAERTLQRRRRALFAHSADGDRRTGPAGSLAVCGPLACRSPGSAGQPARACRGGRRSHHRLGRRRRGCPGRRHRTRRHRGLGIRAVRLGHRRRGCPERRHRTRRYRRLGARAVRPGYRRRGLAHRTSPGPGTVGLCRTTQIRHVRRDPLAITYPRIRRRRRSRPGPGDRRRPCVRRRGQVSWRNARDRRQRPVGRRGRGPGLLGVCHLDGPRPVRRLDGPAEGTAGPGPANPRRLLTALWRVTPPA